MKKGFTLAEVLITLAIIGIVATMTIPTLISKYQERVTVTRVKKFYSVISQAYQMAVMENGPYTTWGVGEISYERDENGKMYLSQDAMERREIFVEKILPYLKNVKYIKFKHNSSLNEPQGIFFPDGIAMVWLWTNAQGGDFYITTDGKLLQNSDFSFRDKAFQFYFDNNKIYPAGYDNESFKNDCLTGKNITHCTGWIIRFGNMEYKRCDDLDMDSKTTCN